MLTESPINSANDLMRSIVSAMDALLAFWREPSLCIARHGGIRNAIDFIDSNYAVMRDLEPQVREYVEDAWNDIIVNEMLRMSVRRLSLACREFMNECVKFEDVWNRHERSALELFADEWLARKYVVLCHECMKKNQEILTAAARGCLPQYSGSKGTGRRVRLFEKYFVDVSDEAFDFFIRFTQPIFPRVKWMGSRAEAVIFAEEFGLTAKDMNRSFIIPSRSGGHRDLNLAGDTPTNNKELYSIWKCIRRYRDLQKDGEINLQ